jgi:hypothetical protein
MPLEKKEFKVTYFKELKSRAIDYARAHSNKISADTMGWIAMIMLHMATIPTLLAILTGLTDNTPTLDVVFFLWAALALFYVKSVINKDTLITVTISVGFMLQATLMALIMFK